MIHTTNILAKFDLVHEYWSPKVVAELNGQAVKLVKLKGEFVWHHHENEDELFLVVKGELMISFRDGDTMLKEGDFLVVPRGVDHKPVAQAEAWVVLFEPMTTLNTGDQRNDLTIERLERI